MKILPIKKYSIKAPNAFERAAEIPPKVFDKIPTPLHVPVIIGGAMTILWMFKQIPLFLQAVINLFRSEDRKIRVIVMNEETKKESEEK